MAATILVADNDPGLVELLATVLADEGYAVLRAHDGAEARALLERERPALLIADLGMPGLSGLELATWVRAGAGVDPHLPILLIIGARGPARPPLATAFLPKPFTLDELMAMVDTLLHPPPARGTG